MKFGLIEILATLLILITGIYYYLIWTYDFWRSRGIIGPEPTIVFGNLKDVALKKTSLTEWAKDIYDKYPDEPMIGIFMRREPVLMLRDIEHIKAILIRDFNKFTHRGAKFDIHQPLLDNLFQMETKRWRPLRLKLSPVFTAGKLREMFTLLNQCCDRLEKYLEKMSGQCLDMRDIAAKFTTDTIGLCIFGVDANALENEDDILRKMGKKVFYMDWKLALKTELLEFIPPLHNLIGGLLMDKTLEDFFISLIRDTIKYREENNVMKNDYVDLLRELKNDSSKIDNIKMTDALMAAQLFVFFVAGFEASSSTISNCLYELAMNHEIQEKLRQDIRKGLAETGGKLTYDAIRKMEYLDKVVEETLRKYPPLTSLLRQSVAEYTFPGTNITIPADTKIFIPIYGIQRDPKHFPEPETFNPENFSEGAISKRSRTSFLTFGDGPRNCIGARFGRLQSKVGLVKILEKFSVDVCEKTDKNYEIDVNVPLLTPANGIVIKVMKCLS